MSECYSAFYAGALSASATKSLIEITAGATSSARLVAWAISFDGSAAAAAPRVEWVRYATTGTGTAYTLLKYNSESQNRAAVCTCKTNLTVEGASPTVVEGDYVPNTAGMMVQNPLGRELYLPPSTSMALRVVTAAGVTPNAVAFAVIEE